jgi:hypothetical protein
VAGYPGPDRGREEVVDPGPAGHGICLRGQGLGPAPFAACHREQRPLAQRLRENIGCARLPHADGIFEERVAALEVTG